jgi:uncharacterized damage-inducible protein DinB
VSTDTLKLQTLFTESVIRRNVGDVTLEESLRAFPASGNGLNWVLGHLVAIRSQLLGAIGGQPVWSAEECEPYDRNAPPLEHASQAKPLAEIWRAFELTQARLLETIGRFTPEDLAQPLAPEAAQPPLVTTRGDLLGVIGFHDAYHAGQTGTLRRLLGKPPASL